MPLGTPGGEPGGEPGGKAGLGGVAVAPLPDAGAEDQNSAVGLSAVVAAHKRTLHLQATGAKFDSTHRVRFSVGLPASGVFVDEQTTPPVWQALKIVEVDAEQLQAGLDIVLKGVPPLGPTCLRAELIDGKGTVLDTSRTSVITL